MQIMKNIACLYLLLLILLSSCEKQRLRMLENTSWQITDYQINGADSMATITALHLEGEFYFNERNSMSTIDLRATAIAHDTTYNHTGTWWAEKKMLEIDLFRGLSRYKNGIGPRVKDRRVFANKPSFKPFRSQWTITKLTKKDMQLELTLDNRKHYLRFKPYTP